MIPPEQKEMLEVEDQKVQAEIKHICSIPDLSPEDEEELLARAIDIYSERIRGIILDIMHLSPHHV